MIYLTENHQNCTKMLAGPQRVIATKKGSSYENLYLSVFNDYVFKNYQSSSIDFLLTPYTGASITLTFKLPFTLFIARAVLTW